MFIVKVMLFLRLSTCASVGEKTLIIIKMHGMYVKKKKKKKTDSVSSCCQHKDHYSKVPAPQTGNFTFSVPG